MAGREPAEAEFRPVEPERPADSIPVPAEEGRLEQGRAKVEKPPYLLQKDRLRRSGHPFQVKRSSIRSSSRGNR